MTGCLKRQGRDTTLRTLKIESLLNLKRPRTRRDRALCSRVPITPARGSNRVGLWAGGRELLPARARVTRVESALLDCQETTGRCCLAVSRGDSYESTD